MNENLQLQTQQQQPLRELITTGDEPIVVNRLGRSKMTGSHAVRASWNYMAIRPDSMNFGSLCR